MPMVVAMMRPDGRRQAEVAVSTGATPQGLFHADFQPADDAQTVVRETVTVTSVDASATAQGQGANKTVQEVLDAAKSTALPLLPVPSQSKAAFGPLAGPR